MVDTNALIYAYDPTDHAKQGIAQRLLEQLVESDSLVLSVQVLNEFYAASTRSKRPPSLTHAHAAAVLRELAESSRVLALSLSTTFLALHAAASYQLPIWDALIWASAKEHGISTIYTEDVPSQPEIEGVRYQNPFANHPLS